VSKKVDGQKKNGNRKRSTKRNIGNKKEREVRNKSEGTILECSGIKQKGE
jgi:hypothetical protein